MSADLDRTVVHLVRECVRDRRLSVGVFYRGNLSMAEQVLAEGHRTVLLGDRFPKLYLAHNRIDPGKRGASVIVETRFDRLPIADKSLDVLIMSSGLPASDSPVATLARLRELVKPGGRLIWPHPISDGFVGKMSRVVDPYRRGNLNASLRRQFCAWVMESGFKEVGQTESAGSFFPWVVTCGRAGRRPWEPSGRVARDSSIYFSFRSPEDVVD